MIFSLIFGGSDAAPASKKSKGPALGGINSEYKRGRTISFAQSSQRSKSAGSAMSVDDFGEYASVPASEYGDSSEGLGGITSEGDDGDEAEYAQQRDTKKVGRLENLSKVLSQVDFAY